MQGPPLHGTPAGTPAPQPAGSAAPQAVPRMVPSPPQLEVDSGPSGLSTLSGRGAGQNSHGVRLGLAGRLSAHTALGLAGS